MSKNGLKYRRRSAPFRMACLLMSVVSLFGLTATGCGGSDDNQDNSEILMTMGDSTLRFNDIAMRIPAGLDAADSAALLRKLADNWVKGMVLTRIAKEKLPDYEDIERQVENFRNRLIAARYLQRMTAGKSHQASPDSIKAFYSRHKGEMTSENPLVKGVYVKLPASSSSVADVRRCIFAGTESAIDEFEKNWMGETLQYDYFEGDWTDWETVAEQIPYRFYDADAFLSSNRNFETTYNGSVYLLHISSWLPSGSELPLEFASPRIAAMLEQAKMASYEESLVKALVEKAIADKTLVAGGYDPLKGEFVSALKDKEKTNLKDEE